ncbi:surface lipoprotein assembly modifier [Wielerella bovis]|uniref:surface lipoprotein assembly modifier n=1 Tax=Wielerella bovis TaxID=2917790 RepID=UPI002019215C|nr:surface lipoprotein assembly modifier [Wielerella bovis]ULJ68404.1 surface lipoprotein assembly modifier [Wielerella bovis]
MKPKIFQFLIFFIVLPAAAQNHKSLDDRRITDEQVHQQIQNTLPVQFEQTVAPTIESKQSVFLSENELQQHPDLLVRALMAALLQGNGENTFLLLPHYQKLPEHLQDSVINIWAQALIARWRGEHTKAVRLYRQVLAQKSDWLVLRLQTAAALLSNKEWEAAEAQFRKIQSESQLPSELASEIEQVLAHIKQQSHWQLNGGATFVNDKNINNAPKKTDLGNGWRGEEAESGQGLSVSMDIDKKWFWQNGLFNEWRLDGSSKFYWNNKRFNEANARVSFGIGHQNANASIAVLPFFEQMWYAGGSKNDENLQRFSNGRGIALEASRTFNSRWQANLYAETVQNRYRTRKHLNGNAHFISLTAAYQHNPSQAWFAGISFNRNNAHDGDDSFIRKSFRVGWLQEWQLFSTRLSASYGWKNYRATGLFNTIQYNRELGIQASVWHRAVHWQGLTPRLTWSYARTNSNIPLFNYNKQRLFVEVNKQF